MGYTSSPTSSPGDELLGLDPHTTFATPDIHVTAATAITNSSGATNIFPNAEYLSQIHVNEFVRLPFSQLDPSLAIGFYFQDRPAFERFCDETRVAAATKLAAGKTPLYAVQHSPPSFMLDSDGSGDEEEDEDEENAEHGGDADAAASDRTKSNSASGGKKKRGAARRRGGGGGAIYGDFDEPGGGSIGGAAGAGADDIEDEYVFL